jgi:hypothetical protein
VTRRLEMSIIRSVALVVSLVCVTASWSVLAADPDHALPRVKADSSSHAAVADNSQAAEKPAVEKPKQSTAKSSSSEKSDEQPVASGTGVLKPASAQATGDRQGDRDPLAANVIDDATLANSRGGSDSHLDQNNSSGTVQANVATNLTTGSNTISQGAFSNSSGIPMVIQNSGNNVLIQNSTILNLQLLK